MRLDHLLSKEASKDWLYYLIVEKIKKFFPVAMRLGVTPVLIPNTMVKTQTADGTALETKWESRWLLELRAYSSAG